MVVKVNNGYLHIKEVKYKGKKLKWGKWSDKMKLGIGLKLE